MSSETFEFEDYIQKVADNDKFFYDQGMKLEKEKLLKQIDNYIENYCVNLDDARKYIQRLMNT